MSNNTPLTLTVTTGTKKLVQNTTPGIRETLDVTIVNLGQSTAANLVLNIQDSAGNIMATAEAFAASGDNALGIVDLNTQELVDAFVGIYRRQTKSFVISIYDTDRNNELAIDDIVIVNNPYTDDLPSPSTIGVTYVATEPTGASFRFRGGNLQIWDSVDLGWRVLGCVSGAPTYGALIAAD